MKQFKMVYEGLVLFVFGPSCVTVLCIRGKVHPTTGHKCLEHSWYSNLPWAGQSGD